MKNSINFTEQELKDLLQDRSITSHFQQAIQIALTEKNVTLIEKVNPQMYALKSPSVS